ncbi:prolyl hydroxylase family protein [Sphingobium sp. TCM1]|uniref:prolyl hydroxylase family protein n=1 Tax=Sphingobium sp. TCM1 TaxID=453246 RepID=UPI0007F4C211|nr:2OG-Fe(II) oxygenase [Sphingobium sp. TCM1]OAN58959.1 oxygenase [Sphingobium sp. TCM1]
MSDISDHPRAADADPAWIAGHPRVQKLPSRDLTLFIQRQFLSAEECAALVDRIEADRRPSTIADANGDGYFRTSETCDLDPADAFVAAIDAKLAAFAGVDPIFGEPIQGQRYAVGQEFKAHTDYFDPKGADFARYCSVAGNRTWTLMVYLNQPAAGGATRFPKVGKTVQPETGKLLAWNNRIAPGEPNPASLHHGMKVRSGVKHVITKWYREKPWG